MLKRVLRFAEQTKQIEEESAECDNFIHYFEYLKQILAISLLLLLSFNWFGYRLLSNFLQHNADLKLEAKLDKEEYDPSQLIELRIPIHLPYHNDWDQFERYDGEIVMNGIHYKYVKRKVEKGELVLLCLPNNDKQMLTSARDQFFQLVNDIQQNPTGKQSEKTNSTSVKNVLSDYHADNHHWGLSPFEIIPPLYASLNTEHFQSADLSSPEQPPESVHTI